jgi:hypothetical protein
MGRTLFVMACLFVVGCGAPSDPAKNFEYHVGNAIRKLNGSDRHLMQMRSNGEAEVDVDAGKWKAYKYAVDEVYEFDVTKTDSMVAPYEAFVKIVVDISISESCDSESVAQQAELKAHNEPKEYTFSYVYRDGEWVLSEGSYQWVFLGEVSVTQMSSDGVHAPLMDALSF